MASATNDIIRRLEKEILPLQGYKPQSGRGIKIGFAPIEKAFPINAFPTGAIHDFTAASAEDMAASAGFITALLGSIMHQGSPCLWIGSGSIFPPALPMFGVVPDNIIFVDIKQQKAALWAIEEALKCERLAAVVGEVKDIGFTESRRLQLAVEQSNVTGFLLRPPSKTRHSIASVSSFRISPLPSLLEDGIPGVGFPRWNVELLKVRNGKPGTWQLEWKDGKFRSVKEKLFSIPQHQLKNVG